VLAMIINTLLFLRIKSLSKEIEIAL